MDKPKKEPEPRNAPRKSEITISLNKMESELVLEGLKKLPDAMKQGAVYKRLLANVETAHTMWINAERSRVVKDQLEKKAEKEKGK